MFQAYVRIRGLDPGIYQLSRGLLGNCADAAGAMCRVGDMGLEKGTLFLIFEHHNPETVAALEEQLLTPVGFWLAITQLDPRVALYRFTLEYLRDLHAWHLRAYEWSRSDDDINGALKAFAYFNAHGGHTALARYDEVMALAERALLQAA